MVLFCAMTIVVIGSRTEAGQRRAEYNTSRSLAGTAQDALANVMVVQSFTRLMAESSGGSGRSPTT